jgi:hypothetical protein
MLRQIVLAETELNQKEDTFRQKCVEELIVPLPLPLEGVVAAGDGSLFLCVLLFYYYICAPVGHKRSTGFRFSLIYLIYSAFTTQNVQSEIRYL